MHTGVNLDFWAARPDMAGIASAIRPTDIGVIRPMNWLGSYWSARLWPEENEGWRWPVGPWKRFAVPLEACVDFVNSLGCIGIYDLPYGLSDEEIGAACRLLEQRSSRPYWVGIGSEAWNGAPDWQDQRKFFAWYGGLLRKDNWQRGYAARLRVARKAMAAINGRGRLYLNAQLTFRELTRQLLFDFGLADVVDGVAVAPYLAPPQRVRVSDYHDAEALALAVAADLDVVAGHVRDFGKMVASLKLGWFAYEAGLHIVNGDEVAAAYDEHWHSAAILRQMAAVMEQAGCEAVCWYKLSEIVPAGNGTRFGMYQAERFGARYVETPRAELLYR